jgi:hypothetical protein
MPKLSARPARIERRSKSVKYGKHGGYQSYMRDFHADDARREFLSTALLVLSRRTTDLFEVVCNAAPLLLSS